MRSVKFDGGDHVTRTLLKPTSCARKFVGGFGAAYYGERKE